MKHRVLAVLVILLVVSLSVGIARSQAAYGLSRSVVPSGGGTSTGGAFVLQGGIGQAFAHSPVTGGAYSLSGGFWAGIEQLFKLILPLVTKN